MSEFRSGLQKPGVAVVEGHFGKSNASAGLPTKLHLPSMPKTTSLRKSDQQLAAQRDDIFVKAYAEGYQKGFGKGVEEGQEKGSRLAYANASEAAMAARKAELEAFTASLQRTLGFASDAMQRWCNQAEEELGPVALEIAHKIMLEELKLGRESVLAIVKDAMSEISHASVARLRVNPLDSALMRSFKDEILGCAQSVRNLEIVDDPTIEGGCVIETDGGLVDARLTGKLKMIAGGLGKAA